MLDELATQKILRTQVLTTSLLPATQAWEGAKFNPPDPVSSASPLVSYLMEHIAFGDETQAATGCIRTNGLATYSIFVPTGSPVDLENLKKITTSVAEAMHPVQILTAVGEDSVHLWKIQRSRAIRDFDHPAWMMQQVVVSWWAHTNNSFSP